MNILHITAEASLGRGNSNLHLVLKKTFFSIFGEFLGKKHFLKNELIHKSMSILLRTVNLMQNMTALAHIDSVFDDQSDIFGD